MKRLLAALLLAFLPAVALADASVPPPSTHHAPPVYTAFGGTYPSATVSGTFQRYTFTGRESSAHNSAGAPMYYRYRQYAPVIGRFGRRDPVLRECNFFGLYPGMCNRPVNTVDTHGLWGTEIHVDGTRLMAEKAGYNPAATPRLLFAPHGTRANFPELIGQWANWADVALDPTKIGPMLAVARLNYDTARFNLIAARAATPGMTGVLDMVFEKNVTAARKLLRNYEVQANRAQRWHFPMDRGSNGVERGSASSRALVEISLKRCDLEFMSKALHILQDSYSHQGAPVQFEGRMGHARDRHGMTDPARDLKERRLLAGMSEDADDPNRWRRDAKDALIETWTYLDKFRKQCDCIRAGAYAGTKRSEYWVPNSLCAKSDVWNTLERTYPGENEPFVAGVPRVTEKSTGWGLGARIGAGEATAATVITVVTYVDYLHYVGITGLDELPQPRELPPGSIDEAVLRFMGSFGGGTPPSWMLP